MKLVEDPQVTQPNQSQVIKVKSVLKFFKNFSLYLLNCKKKAPS